MLKILKSADFNNQLLVNDRRTDDNTSRVSLRLKKSCSEINHCQNFLVQVKSAVKDPRFKFMFLTLLVVLLLNADQNLLAPSLTLVSQEFNFTSQEKDLYLGGYLNLCFFVCGGVAAIFAGYIADTSNRRYAFTSIVLIGEISCFCTLFVQDYWGLLVTRMFTGLATGAALPILYSLIGDSFVDTWRGRMVSLLAIMVGLGVIVGQGIAGAIAPIYGWRAPFVAVSVPGILLTLIFGCYAKEPARGGGERVLFTTHGSITSTISTRITNVDDEPNFEILGSGGSYSEKMTRKKFLQLFSSKTVVLLLLNSIPTNLPWGFLIVYAQDFLVHDVGPNVVGGISTDESYLIVILFAVSSGISTIIGGVLADFFWKKKRVRLVPLLSSLFVIIGAGPMFVIINASLNNVYGYYLLAIPAGFLSGLATSPKYSMLLNVTLPETRGTCFAINTILDDLGKGLGSFFIAILIVAFNGRLPAFNVAISGWLFAGVLFFLTVFTLQRDLDKVTKKLLKVKEKMMKSSKNPIFESTIIALSSTASDSLETNSPIHIIEPLDIEEMPESKHSMKTRELEIPCQSESSLN